MKIVECRWGYSATKELIREAIAGAATGVLLATMPLWLPMTVEILTIEKPVVSVTAKPAVPTLPRARPETQVAQAPSRPRARPADISDLESVADALETMPPIEYGPSGEPWSGQRRLQYVSSL
jgi:hypothetical protein